MAPFRTIMALSILTGLLSLPFPAFAGGEEEKEAKKQAQEKAPEDTALPQEKEAPELSIGNNEEPLPDFEEGKSGSPTAVRRVQNGKPFEPDENVDYSRLLDMVEVADPGQGVLPPALGFRGYRPNYVAFGVGDRTPGLGGLIEYSWNRIAGGVFASYLNTHGQDRGYVERFGFAGIYGLYRWLPFDTSPFISLGLEGGSKTDESFGGLTGLGVEARIYNGWTATFGWTFHSVAHRGFLGGSFGWSF